MKTFSPLATSITVEFACPRCGKHITQPIDGIPNIVDNLEKPIEETIVCENCCSKFTYTLYSYMDKLAVEIKRDNDDYVNFEITRISINGYSFEFDSATMQKINDSFCHYHVTSSVVGLFGDWAVSQEGDIINIEQENAFYPLFSGNALLNDNNVLFEHLGTKTWFDTYQEQTLKQALEFRKSLI